MMLTGNRKIIIFLVTIFLVIAIDQVSKSLVAALMEPGSSLTLIPHVIRITYTRNTGAAFGLFAGSGQIVFWSALVVVMLMLFWFYRSYQQTNVWWFVALGLLIGGAVGNLADRILRGRVVDFFDLGWWPVFNVADLAIVTGVIMFIVVICLEMTGRGVKKEGKGEGE